MFYLFYFILFYFIEEYLGLQFLCVYWEEQEYDKEAVIS